MAKRNRFILSVHIELPKKEAASRNNMYTTKVKQSLIVVSETYVPIIKLPISDL